MRELLDSILIREHSIALVEGKLTVIVEEELKEGEKSEE